MTSVASGWRSGSLAADRARRPSSMTLRIAATSSSSSSSARLRAGQPARNTDRGASGHTAATRCCQRCSVRNGSTGETARRLCTSDTHSVRRAASSPFQKRRRDRRMYQFDRSSTYCSNARSTFTVR